jgi:hypothetical protein
LVSWTGELAGTFQMNLTVHSAHIKGSPLSLSMASAELEVSMCEFVAEKTATAGVSETIKLICRDPYGNDAGTLAEVRRRRRPHRRRTLDAQTCPAAPLLARCSSAACRAVPPLPRCRR